MRVVKGHITAANIQIFSKPQKIFFRGLFLLNIFSRVCEIYFHIYKKFCIFAICNYNGHQVQVFDCLHDILK